MKRLSLIIGLVLAALAVGQEGPATRPATAPATGPAAGSQFTYVDVMIDPKGQPLAAWQVEFAAEVGKITLVGVEQGEHAAYAKRPPYYDPAALAGNRIILGDFSLDEQLPKAKTRVARLMIEIRGGTKPQYVARIMAAASADGKKIPAEVAIVPAP